MSTQGGVVLDASAALSWILNDADPNWVRKIDELLTNGFALVPELWHAEVANGIGNAVRRGLLRAEMIPEICELLGQLDIRTDVVGNPVLRLAHAAIDHGLTSYDVAYFLLARDRGLPLATLDRALAHVAAAHGVALAV